MTPHSPARQLLALVACLALAYLASAVGAAASINAGAFYSELARPAWAPPGWLFGPVWTVLYGLMGVALWGIWRERGLRNAPIAYSLFGLQLVLNALWSWLFFVWKSGAWAFIGIVILWFLILATLVSFWKIKAWAGGLLLPYLVWVSFATALTLSVWRANPQVLG